MPFDRIRLGRCISFAFAGDDVKQLRPAQLFDVPQRRDERLDVVAIDGSDVIEAHLLEQSAGQHHPLQMFLRAARKLPDGRHLPQHLLAALAQMRIHAPRQRSREIIRQGAHVLRNRHVVVIQDDQQIRRQRAGMIEGLKGHAGGQRAIPDDRDRASILAASCGRHRHTERRADRGARVAHAEGVVLAFGSGRERGEAAILFDGVQKLAATGQHFVRIGLMTHVPHQPVIGCIEDVMQGDRQLDGAQSGGKMPAPRADALDQELPQLVRQGRQVWPPASAAGQRAP